MFFHIFHTKVHGGSGDHWTLRVFDAQTHDWSFYNSLQPRGATAKYKSQ